jgi:predicted alpha-1,2-mannosidase
MPFGMLQVSPDTRTEGWDACGGYYYSDSTILGFSHLHLSGTGVPDYGDLLIMPVASVDHAVVQNGKLDRRSIAARFSHANEAASPGYYRVDLSTGIRSELSVTRRTGMHRYTYPGPAGPCMFIDLAHGLGPDKVMDAYLARTAPNELCGHRVSRNWAKEQQVYFVVRFSQPCTGVSMFRDGSMQQDDSLRGADIASLVRFTAGVTTVMVKVGISSVSIENARRNLDRENPGWDFDAVHKRATAAWERELGRIVPDGGTREQQVVFTTALYHAMLTPNLYSDVDGRYRGMDGRVHTAKGFDMYTVFSLWDTFRAEHPLLSIIDRKRTQDFVRSLLARYSESGVLPVWELSANETWCMIGYHAVPVIVDSYMKGIRGFDAGLALEAMMRSAGMDHFGLAAYRSQGFIPSDQESEAVSRTLEYGYDDWCIARFAEALGRRDVSRLYYNRSLAYRNLFDPAAGFMRPRSNGGWLEPFDPSMVSYHFTEANSWQYSTFVPHDIDGLVSMYGGPGRFCSKLDSLFSTSEKLSGREQADITGLIGQYAQGNEPSHHAAYLYNYVGQPWKTQSMTRIIVDSLYKDRPDGLCGNDDCGQMSAWLVMSAMGLYQVAPGRPEYCLGSPLFPRITIRLENGRRFVIEADGNERGKCYVTKPKLNGRALDASFIPHSAIASGGLLMMTMSPTPDTTWARTANTTPHAEVAVPYCPAPVINAGSRVFRDSTIVTVTGNGGRLFYTLDGSDPILNGREYMQPLILRESAAVNAAQRGTDGAWSRIASASVVNFVPPGEIRLATVYSKQYAAGGDNALLDGMHGGRDFRTGTWQGYEESDIDATVDLGSVKNISSVAIGFYQNCDAWIFMPSSVEFSFSDDGTRFTTPRRIDNTIDPKKEGAIVHDFTLNPDSTSARFVRVHAVNMRHCPVWHKGAGGKAWIFADEIMIDAR